MADRLPDPAEAVELPGSWQHRYVAANGARFHVAEAGAHDAPLVLMLHGFPEFWWSWRHQLPTVAGHGHRTVAMDLRGYGGSDKTPRGYDPVTLARDVSGVVKALGARDAVLVGHGWGGYVAWATAVLHAREVSAVCAVAAPHPSTMLGLLRRGGSRVGVLRHVLAMQVPMLPERRLADPSSGFLRQHLRAWAGPGSAFPTEAEVTTYQRAISRWPSSHCALEYHRWLLRSRLRSDGRRFNRLMRPAVRQPVLCVAGERDPAVPPDAVRASAGHVAGDFTVRTMPGAGHFAHEEQPAAFTEVLTSWLEPVTG